MYTYVPVLTSYIESLGASHKMAGTIIGSYGFVQMILRIPLGILSDRMHKKKIFITIGLFFAALSGLGLLLSNNLSLILIFRALTGVAAATWVDFTILFSSYYKKEETTKAMGTISFFNSLGQMTAMYMGGILADKVGYTSTFALGTVVGVVGIVLSFFLIENHEKGAQKITLKGLTEVITDKNLIYISLIAVLSQLLTFATTYGFTPVFADINLHISKYQIGILTLFSSLPTAIASIVGGRYYVRKYGEKKVIICGFILVGIFTAVIPFVKYFWLLILTQMFVGFGRGLSFTMLLGLSIKDMPSNKRSTAMGFFQSIYGLGMFLGPVIMGLIGDFISLNQGFIILGIIGLFTGLLSYLCIKESSVVINIKN
jgi:predicted MFS family arabinose efflux permease